MVLLSNQKPEDTSQGCLGCGQKVTGLIITNPADTPWLKHSLCPHCYHRAELNEGKPVPPGVLIKKLMREKLLSDNNLRKRIGCSKKDIFRLYEGRASLDYLVARVLSSHLGYPVVFWLSLESNYRVMLKKEHEDATQRKNGNGTGRNSPIII